MQTSIFSVTDLNLQARELLEGHFGNLSVEGEISNFAHPRSGHMYFSLKDANSQVRCAMFRMNNRRLNFAPENGMQVLVQGRVSLYPERGDFQLIVQSMEDAGAGDLRRAFEALKAKLAAEGLFDSEHKQSLPTLPQRIGIITSPTGAAVRDVLSVLKRRFASIPVLIYPVPVQGSEAPGKIAHMLELANRRAECDVLILTRGGGSLEDLWAFNEEIVARAIAASEIPVISAIGHEVDFSIADFVADQRAATPSAAAELISPDAREWRQRRDNAIRRLDLMARGRLREDRQALDWLLRRLRHPSRHLQMLREQRTGLLNRLQRAMNGRVSEQRQNLAGIMTRFQAQDPRTKLPLHRQLAQDLNKRLHRAIHQRLNSRRQSVESLIRAMHAISPQATLERGYAIVTRQADGALVNQTHQVKSGDRITTQLAHGRLLSQIESVDEDSEGLID